MARRSKSRSERRRTPGSGEVRIIGGDHRGRRLKFPDLPGLRPTGDRIRETLFNWLQPLIPGSACLDLFAGSGALGLEAASRGAGLVVLLERASEAVRQLRANVEMLGSASVRIEQGSALQWLERPAVNSFDLVFLDPPFDQDIVSDVCRLLVRYRWLKPGAHIYLEMDAERPVPELPETWELLRRKRAGQVIYSLFGNSGSGK